MKKVGFTINIFKGSAMGLILIMLLFGGFSVFLALTITKERRESKKIMEQEVQRYKDSIGSYKYHIDSLMDTFEEYGDKMQERDSLYKLDSIITKKTINNLMRKRHESKTKLDSFKADSGNFDLQFELFARNLKKS